MPFVRQMEKQFERGKKGQLISQKFAKSKVAVKITVVVVVDEVLLVVPVVSFVVGVVVILVGHS